MGLVSGFDYLFFDGRRTGIFELCRGFVLGCFAFRVG
jgi:hypothetical protein